jgi:hypothetical protein
MKLFVCSGCGRHVRDRATTCPFCGVASSSGVCTDGPTKRRRVSRAVLMTGAVMALADCDTTHAAFYGAVYCPDTVDLSSPCGFVSVTSTCAGATPTCGSNTLNATCTVGPIQANCTVTVVLGDGTTHTVPVTLATDVGCGDASTVASPPGTTDFASARCQAMPPSDAGDAADDGGG